MSFSALWISSSGLGAAQRGLEVTAHNVANVNTEGYTRQRVDQTAASARPLYGGAGELGNGVTVAAIQRLREAIYDDTYRFQAAEQGVWDTRSQFLSQVEQVLGPLDSGLSDTVTQFWSSWDQLTLHPGDTAPRQAVLNAGNQLAGGIRNAASNLSSIVSQANDQTRVTVDEVNRLAGQVVKLNNSIADALNSGQQPNDLYDQRDVILDQLSGLTGATIRNLDQGRVAVIVSGRALVKGPDATALKTSTTDPATITWEDGSPASPAGKLGALVALTHDVLPSLRADLDALAVGLRDQVNAAHRAGYDAGGAAGLDFFTGTSAIDLQVNPAVTPAKVAASATAAGAPADGNNTLVVAGLRNAPAVGSLTLRQAVEALGARMGALAADASDNAKHAAVSLDGFRQQRAASNSVSLDEEMANIIKYQQSYAAAARMVTAADEMLDVLVNRTGLVGR